MTEPEMRILRIREVAKLLAVSRQTVWRWSREGKFPAPVKLGPAITGWRARDIEQWLDARVAADSSRSAE